MVRLVSGVVTGLLLASAISGCVSYGTVHTAEPVESGGKAVSLGGGASGGVVQGEHAGAPLFFYQNRLGITDSLDAGLRLQGVGLAADLNYAFLQRPSWTLSFDPELSFVANQPAGVNKLGARAAPQIANRLGLRLNLLADVLKLPHFDWTFRLAPGWLVATGPNFLGSDGLVAEAGTSMRYVVPGRMIQSAIPFVFASFDTFVPFGRRPAWRGRFGYSGVAGVGMKL